MQQWQQPQAQFSQSGSEAEEKFNIYTPMDEDDIKAFSAILDGLVGTKESIKVGFRNSTFYAIACLKNTVFTFQFIILLYILRILTKIFA